MGRKTTLPILGGYLGWAQAINNQGQVTGAAENSTLDSSCPPDLAYNQFIPVTWWNRRIHVLPLIAGDLDGAGFGMNDSGQVVGATGDCLHNFHATLWHDGRVTDLGNLGGSSGNQAFDINDGGQVVGNSRLPDGTIHGFRWQHGVMTDVGALPAFAYSFATGINDKGQVSGNSCAIDFSRCSAFIWQNGVMTDFNTLIPAGSPLVLLQARSINSRGEAAGYALHVATGEIHAFLATPCIGNRCDSGVLDTTAVERASAGAHLALPENVRHMLELALTSRRPGQAQPTHD
jgi:probable HAF family extracellular repeat protein